MALWAVCLVASAALHAAGYAALLRAVAPAKSAVQPAPDRRLDVASYTVDRVTAPEAQASPDAAPSAAPAPTGLGSGAIPSGRIIARAPEAEAVAALPGAAIPLAAPAMPSNPAPALAPDAAPLDAGGGTDPLPATPVDPADAMVATSSPDVQASPAPALAARADATLAPAPPDTRPLAGAAPTPVATAGLPTPGLRIARSDLPLVPAVLSRDAPATAPPLPVAPAEKAEAALPSATPLPGTRPKAPNAGSLDIAGLPAGRVRPDPDALPPQPPEPDRFPAVLAWSGTLSAALDPLALAAAQAFMAPAASAAASAVRDALKARLAAVPCARLQAMFDPDTGTLAVVGHVPTLSRADAVLADLQAAVGVHIPVRGDLRLLPEPQCSALAGVDALGLPQSSEQITNPRVVGPDAFARTFDFVENDRLRLDLETPDYEAYLYIDYFDASGQVIHLAPNDIVPLTRHPPETELRIGDATGNGPALDIRIGPPFGQEIAVAFATSAPLDTGGRPLSEPAGPYLDWLRTEIARTRAATPDFRGEWAYFFVTTAPRNAPRP